MKRTGFKKKATKPLKKKPTNKSRKTIKLGKKTSEWVEVKANLKETFLSAGITVCELGWESCTKTLFLGFAHSKPRRHIVGDEIYEVILACTSCHEKLDLRMSTEEGYHIVLDVIKNRKNRI